MLTTIEKLPRIAVVGLGYVGLPLSVELAKRRPVIGFDVDSRRINALRAGHDSTLEVEDHELAEATHLSFTDNPDEISDCPIYIIAVPTPIDISKRPNLNFLVMASETVGKVLQRGDIVIYESTVYPGATEEICVPILERMSGLIYNEGFFCGYSPERINPGDKSHRLTNIVKVTSGSTPEVADVVDSLYRGIVTVGTHKVSSIRVAEAAKVIENTQRDVNIALVNELALIFNRLNIDTEEVLQAAATKWNFLPFRPGLVGGHCIGVDPYYLTHKAQEIGYHPEIISAGRRINDGMGMHIVSRLVKEMLRRRIHIKGSRILIMGLSFKENCPDIRNTRVIDIVNELLDYGAEVDVHDPWVDPDEVRSEYGIDLTTRPPLSCYDAIVLAVSHCQFVEAGGLSIRRHGKNEHVLFDVKYTLSVEESDLRL